MELTVNGNRYRRLIVILGLATSFATSWAWGLGLDSFTYQGMLRNQGVPFNGMAAFVFRLYDAESAGNQIGPDVTFPDLDIVFGEFTVRCSHPRR